MLHTTPDPRPLLPGDLGHRWRTPPGRAWTTRPGTPLSSRPRFGGARLRLSGRATPRRRGPAGAAARTPPAACAAVRAGRAREAIARWRVAPGSPARWASSPSSRAQPSARACGQQASTSVARRPEAGTQRSRCGSSSCASMPSRAARKRFSSSTSGACESSGSAQLAERLAAHEALDQRDQRRRVADARLRVHHPHLERAELRLQADVPPDERRLRDRAAADQDVDRLDVGGVGVHLARDARAREGLEDGRAGARRARCRARA